MLPAYTVKYSRRRTVAIHITPQGEVEVRAPFGASASRIRGFLEAKAGWVAQKQQEARARCLVRQQFSLEPGQSLSVLGCPRVVELGPAGCRPLLEGDRLLLPDGSSQQRQDALEVLCRALAHRFLLLRVRELAESFGLGCAGVTITGARTRWGSCSGKNRLSFSFRLMYADPLTVDYVIVHELAHTRHHDHSPGFWALVGELMPGYRAQEQALRTLQERLFLQNL